MLVAAIDAEIARLLEVRRLLAGTDRQLTHTVKKRTRRQMSPEARARIAEGQRRRWAEWAKAKQAS